MTKKDRKTPGMKIQHIDPQKIRTPEVRITSDFDPEILEMFRSDVGKTGIQQPLIIAKSGEELYVIDGLHRLDEAKLRGFPTVPCIISEMDIRELQLRNLVLNRMRGKTKASEEVMMIRDLWENHNCGIEEIVERTGMKRERLEQLIAIGSAHHEVWEALDREEIKVCHSYQLSRLVDSSAQLRMLQVCRQYRMKCPDLKETVDETIRILAEHKENSTGEPAVAPPPIPSATCQFCHGEYPVQQLSSPIMCMSCYGYMVAAIQTTEKEIREEDNNKRQIAEEVLGIPNKSGDTS